MYAAQTAQSRGYRLSVRFYVHPSESPPLNQSFESERSAEREACGPVVAWPLALARPTKVACFIIVVRSAI